MVLQGRRTGRLGKAVIPRCRCSADSVVDEIESATRAHRSAEGRSGQGAEEDAAGGPERSTISAARGQIEEADASRGDDTGSRRNPEPPSKPTAAAPSMSRPPEQEGSEHMGM